MSSFTDTVSAESLAPKLALPPSLRTLALTCSLMPPNRLPVSIALALDLSSLTALERLELRTSPFDVRPGFGAHLAALPALTLLSLATNAPAQPPPGLLTLARLTGLRAIALHNILLPRADCDLTPLPHLSSLQLSGRCAGDPLRLFLPTATGAGAALERLSIPHKPALREPVSPASLERIATLSQLVHLEAGALCAAVSMQVARLAALRDLTRLTFLELPTPQIFDRDFVDRARGEEESFAGYDWLLSLQHLNQLHAERFLVGMLNCRLGPLYCLANMRQLKHVNLRACDVFVRHVRAVQEITGAPCWDKLLSASVEGPLVLLAL